MKIHHSIPLTPVHSLHEGWNITGLKQRLSPEMLAKIVDPWVKVRLDRNPSQLPKKVSNIAANRNLAKIVKVSFIITGLVAGSILEGPMNGMRHFNQVFGKDNAVSKYNIDSLNLRKAPFAYIMESRFERKCPINNKIEEIHDYTHLQEKIGEGFLKWIQSLVDQISHNSLQTSFQAKSVKEVSPEKIPVKSNEIPPSSQSKELQNTDEPIEEDPLEEDILLIRQKLEVPEKIINFLEQSAIRGNIKAWNQLGMICLRNNDRVKAEKYFLEAYWNCKEKIQNIEKESIEKKTLGIQVDLLGEFSQSAYYIQYLEISKKFSEPGTPNFNLGVGMEAKEDIRNGINIAIAGYVHPGSLDPFMGSKLGKKSVDSVYDQVFLYLAGAVKQAERNNDKGNAAAKYLMAKMYIEEKGNKSQFMGTQRVRKFLEDAREIGIIVDDELKYMDRGLFSFMEKPLMVHPQLLWLYANAIEGNPDAQLQLSDIYRKGFHLPQYKEIKVNLKLSKKWLEEISENHYINLSLAYAKTLAFSHYKPLNSSSF